MVVLWVEWSCYNMKGDSPQLGDDVIIIFGAARARSVQDWAHNMTDTKLREKFDALTESESLEFKVPTLRLCFDH